MKNQSPCYLKTKLELIEKCINMFNIPSSVNRGSLFTLTTDLDALINELEIDRWFQESLRTEWWKLELIKAILMDEERMAICNENQQAIAQALANIKTIIIQYEQVHE